MGFIICFHLIRLLPKVSWTSPSRTRLLALARTDGLQEPNVKVFHVAGTGPHNLPHARQNVFERFQLQSKLCKRRGALVSFEPKREILLAGLRVSAPLLLESKRALGHRRGVALCLIDLVH